MNVRCVQVLLGNRLTQNKEQPKHAVAGVLGCSLF